MEPWEILTRGVHKPHKHKLAIFVCGASGSGKSSSLHKFLKTTGTKTTFVYLNLDSFVKLICAETPCYEKARPMFSKMISKTVENEYSFVYDGTCRNFKEVKNLMNHVKTRSYKIILIMTYVNKESALHRISRRTEQPLDLKIANEIYQQIQKYAEKYMSIEDIDMIYLYNNELETELIYKKTMKKVFCMSPFSNFYFDVSKFC